MEGAAQPIHMAMAWHGRLMVLAWVILFPAGVLFARFFKVTPRQRWPEALDNRTWWYIHLGCQYSGAIVVAVAIWLILQAPYDPSRNSWYHATLGWLVVGLCGAQIASGLLRGSRGGPGMTPGDGPLPGDHYDMTLRRRVFELFHKGNGYLVLGLSIASVITGLSAALAPPWMLPSIVLWWSVCIGVFIVCQRRGLAMSSYHAIWGPLRDRIADVVGMVASDLQDGTPDVNCKHDSCGLSSTEHTSEPHLSARRPGASDAVRPGRLKS